MDQEIQSYLKGFQNWTGSKKELLSILLKVEDTFPNGFLFISKQKKVPLKVNARRIQQFLDNQIMPLSKGHLFYYEHIIHYLAAIKMKNEGHSIRQISKLMGSLSRDEIMTLVISSDKVGFYDDVLISQTSSLSERLRVLGRPEGRTLRTQILRLAITPWCHVSVNKKELANLTPDDCVTLAEAFHLSLLETVKLSKNKTLDSKVS